MCRISTEVVSAAFSRIAKHDNVLPLQGVLLRTFAGLPDLDSTLGVVQKGAHFVVPGLGKSETEK